MSIRTPVFMLTLAVTLLAGSSATFGQVRFRHEQPTRPVEPGYFEHDFQYFAPADITEFGGGPAAPIGWYFTYSRLYWNVSNPRTSGQPWDSEWTWGNRWNGGFMTEEDHGWDLEYLHLSGPNEFSVDPVLGTSALVQQSDLESIEVSKTFRMKGINGNYFEPFIGARFVGFRDETTPGASILNNIVGAQIGFRWFKKKGRWTTSGALRAFPAVNFQHFRDSAQDEFVIAGDARLQTGYNMTRDISLVAGWELLHFGKGIARGNAILFNDQSMTSTGLTFGIEIKK